MSADNMPCWITDPAYTNDEVGNLQVNNVEFDYDDTLHVDIYIDDLSDSVSLKLNDQEIHEFGECKDESAFAKKMLIRKWGTYSINLTP